MFCATDYMITIVELHTFQAEADRVFSDEQREALSDFIAANPHFGDVIPGTGGVRKIKWSSGSKKRGMVRVIYYFRDLNVPVFLPAIYKSGEGLNLTMAEREAMRAYVDRLVAEYSDRRWANIFRIGREPA